VGTFRSAADDDAADRDREELKRLLYVAVTRARDRLYLATTLDDRGRFEVAKGGLGDVLPVAVRAVFERAAATPPDGADGWLEWQGASDVHRFAHVVAAAAPVPLEIDRSQKEVPSEFTRLTAAPSAARVRISTVGAGPAIDRQPLPEPLVDAPDPRRLGTLVHRLLEHDALGGALDAEALRDLAERLLSGDHRRGAANPRRLVDAALRLIGQMAQNEALTASMSGPRWHEVPVAYNDGRRIWRGALDTLVAIGPGLREVLEFKTGRPRPAHEEQLALYVAAIAALDPGLEVSGRVVYLHTAHG
jgi:ATP-dependent helicase/nuclease subunit A